MSMVFNNGMPQPMDQKKKISTPQTYPISFLALHKSRHAIRVKFTLVDGVHEDYLAVAKVLKNKCELTVNGEKGLKKIAERIKKSVEAQRNGEGPSDAADDEIAIRDDAMYLIGRDISQEILLKDLRKYGKQQSELNKATQEQLEAIVGEKKRHEKELNRIEQARTEAGRARKDRITRAEKEKEDQEELAQKQQQEQQEQQESGGTKEDTSTRESNERSTAPVVKSAPG